MLKSERMSKAVITAPKSYLAKTIEALYSLHAVHIIDHNKGEFDIGTPIESASTISETLITIRALVSHLGLENEKKLSNGFRAMGVKNFSQLAKTAKTLQEEVNAIVDKSKEADSQLRILEAKEATINTLAGISLPLEAYRSYGSINVFAGHVKDTAKLDTELKQFHGEVELYAAKTVAVLLASKEVSEKILDVLSGNSFSEIDLSGIQELDGTPSENLDRIKSKKEKLNSTKQSQSRHLEKLGKKWHDFLLLSETFLSIELEKAEAPLRFASSENVFVVSGWIPEKNVKSLEEKVNRITKKNVDIKISKPTHHDNVPVKLANAKPAKPFEFLMRLYALPQYAEIDPTIFMSITFPLFFGIILGDVGYGLTIALLSIFLTKKYPGMATLTKIIMPSALSSIFFGLIFGEVFGFEELFGYHIPRLISRVHQIEEMLYISVAIGIIHVNIGLLLGFINELEHGLKKAILAKGSWWLLQLAIAGIATSSMTGIPNYYSFALAGLSVVMIYLGESMAGIIEIPGLVSNVLSYSRLMAVGLASVGLATVVNGFIEEFAHAGGLMVIPAIIIGILGHTLNIALGILGGFLHSIRLHYVEFFTKFFKGGAVPFRAFGTEDETQ